MWVAGSTTTMLPSGRFTGIAYEVFGANQEPCKSTTCSGE
jgi:hypothetical protein